MLARRVFGVLARLGCMDPLEWMPTSNAAAHAKRSDWALLSRVAHWAGVPVRLAWGLGLPVLA